MNDRDYPDGTREQIHLPGSSVVPLMTGLGITIALVGLVLSWWLVAAGGVVFAISVARWISAVREEVASLPVDRA